MMDAHSEKVLQLVAPPAQEESSPPCRSRSQTWSTPDRYDDDAAILAELAAAVAPAADLFNDDAAMLAEIAATCPSASEPAPSTVESAPGRERHSAAGKAAAGSARRSSVTGNRSSDYFIDKAAKAQLGVSADALMNRAINMQTNFKPSRHVASPPQKSEKTPVRHRGFRKGYSAKSVDLNQDRLLARVTMAGFAMPSLEDAD
eukprot:TRINITY_DN50799_c0_g1_i1.p1 TRINITY_DN50799_c0_g1~~TRINITY_DN50799_c0_g1_i1.p1  ORF type:complete len:203 (-),score=31.26 TRINITY_DN50799_c0_g1_i1:461-1069(-)